MLPVRFAAEVGENFAVKVALCPAMRVDGVASPPVVTPAPEILICEMVMVAEPELVRLMDDEPEDPTITLPKFTLVGLAVRLP